MERAELAARVHQRLLERQETVCCAESLTGGGLSDLLSATPGASATFVGGVVSYATEVKRRVLGVTADRVVSPDCVRQMAAGVRDLLRADWAVATTGVAGPAEQDGEPVGTVYVGLAGPHDVRVQRLSLGGDRHEVRAGSCRAALEELLDGLG